MKYLQTIILLFVLFNFQYVSGQKWKDIGPPSGVTLGVYCHPTDPNRIYLILDIGHIFRSDDKGENWKRISHPVALATMPWRQYRGGEHCVAIDPRPAYGNIIYFAPGQQGAGLWKSTDYGDTWFKTNGIDDLGASVIMIDYKGTVFCIAHNHNIYNSTDGGNSWSDYPVPFTIRSDWFNPVSYKLSVAISANNTIWATDRTEGSGLYFSNNKGKDWNQLLEGTQIVDLACSPVDSNLVVALEQDGRIFRSADSKGNFSQTGSVQQNDYWSFDTWPPHTGSIAVNASGTVIAIGRYSLGRSTDGGLNFTETNESNLNYKADSSWPFSSRTTTDQALKCCDLSASPVDSTFWIFGDGSMRKISTDNGLSWVGGKGAGAEGLWMYGNPTFDAADPNVFHVACVDLGHAYTTDLGKTWFSTEKGNGSCQGVTQDPNNYNIFYKTHKQNNAITLDIYKSTDRGHSFSKISAVELANSDYGGRIFVDPTDSKIIYCTIRGGKGVYRSTDGGENFTNIYSKANIHHSAITPTGNVFFHIWNGSGLYRYIKSSREWKNIASAITGNVDGFAVNPKDENIIFMNAAGTLYKTTNGLSASPVWEVKGNYEGRQIYIDPFATDYMLMMTDQKNVGMMISIDAGENWEIKSDNLGTNFVWGFVPGGPSAKGRVYAFDATAYYIDDIYDSTSVSVSENNNKLLPVNLNLGHAYPNPFNSSIQVPFYLSGNENIRLEIFNILGEKIRTLINGIKSAGKHMVYWDGKDDKGGVINSGIYFVHLFNGKEQIADKIIYLK